MGRRQFVIHGMGGLDLRAHGWLPDAAPRGVVAVVHGLGEHAGRYHALASALAARHYAVYALDHRGHGLSPGPRADIGRFDHLVTDTCTFAGHCAREHPDLPVFLLGHSMGGAAAFAAALRVQDALRGLVLSAPLLAFDGIPAWQRLGLAALARLSPQAGAVRIDPSHVSREVSVVQDYRDDPLVHHDAVPARTLHELVRATGSFPDAAPGLKVPVLVLHGTADRLVPLAAQRPVYQALGSRRRTLRIYEGLYHEVFNEPEREAVIADLLGWLDAH